jgi:ABC-type multidrug transport system fused ATPase/permease subunit
LRCRLAECLFLAKKNLISRRLLGNVRHDIFLLSGTVMENIRHGRAEGAPDAMDAEVIAAVKLVMTYK